MSTTTDFLTTADLAAAIVAAGWANVYGTSNLAMNAMKAGVISAVARVLSQSTVIQMDSLDADKKNQILVAVLNALDAYRSKGNPVKFALTGTAIDLIGQEMLKLTGMTDKVILGGGA